MQRDYDNKRANEFMALMANRLGLSRRQQADTATLAYYLVEQFGEFFSQVRNAKGKSNPSVMVEGAELAALVLRIACEGDDLLDPKTELGL